MHKNNPLSCVVRALLLAPVAVFCVVAAFYLLLLAYSPLMRVKWFSDRTRRFSTRANLITCKFAGTRWGMVYFNLSALHHVGRRSGRAYVTPLSAYPLGDGFVLGVAYPEVDWCANVLAAGTCSLTHNGKDYALEHPEIITREQAMPAYPLLIKPFIYAPGTTKFLWLHRANSPQQQRIDATTGSAQRGLDNDQR
jgi:hypothetical protein